MPRPEALQIDMRLFAAVRRIPRGRAVPYGVLGRSLRPPVGPRRVGQALGRCPEDVPWQRVVGAGGRLAELPSLGGKSLQRKLLEREGVGFTASGKVAAEFLLEGPP